MDLTVEEVHAESAQGSAYRPFHPCQPVPQEGTSMTTHTSVLSSRIRVGGRSRLRDLKQVSSAWTAAALGHHGTLPSFLVIGAQRAGTTALFNTLAQHPQIRTPIAKELQYLSLNYGRGNRWYAAHFPTVEPGEVTFEASPYYLFHPLAAQRAAVVLPEVRAVAMLRDPVKRAYSQWQHSTMHGFESLPFVDAIRAEPERLARAERLGRFTRKGEHANRHHAYLSRGRYAQQLEVWHEALGADRVHVIRSEEYFAQAEPQTAELIRFLGLHQVAIDPPPRTNHWVDGPSQLTPGLERELRERLAPDNARLAQLLGWGSTPWL